ncbi:MAG: zinc ribbon domain-containing protein [Oscillospiraceae bacterium]|nr:zinc ribbon domain-containing protein [Oscillospiraceae bacterium]
MYCFYCGKQIKDTNKFCQYCGMAQKPQKLNPPLGSESSHIRQPGAIPTHIPVDRIQNIFSPPSGETNIASDVGQTVVSASKKAIPLYVKIIAGFFAAALVFFMGSVVWVLTHEKPEDAATAVRDAGHTTDGQSRDSMLDKEAPATENPVAGQSVEPYTESLVADQSIEPYAENQVAGQSAESHTENQVAGQSIESLAENQVAGQSAELHTENQVADQSVKSHAENLVPDQSVEPYTEDLVLNPSTGQYADESEYLKTATLLNASAFSEGYAWVQYHNGNAVNTAVIDTNGSIVFLSNEPILYASDFKDGLAFYITSPNAFQVGLENFSYGMSSNVFMLNNNNAALFFHIIDESGKTTSVNYRILTYGDNQFLAATHISNFDLDEWLIGTIDKHGDVVNEFRNYTWESWSSIKTFNPDDFSYGSFNDVTDRYRYAGEGVFLLHGDLWQNMFFYNARTQSFTYQDGRSTRILGEYYNGAALGRNSMYYTSDGGCLLLDEYGESLERSRDFPLNDARRYSDLDTSNYNYISAIRDNNPPLFPVGDGLVYYDHSYYDLEGNEIIALTKYNDKAMFGGPFSGGYAALLIIGADGFSYVTVIDRNGTEQFTPRRTDRINFFLNEGSLLTCTGNTIQILNTQGAVVREISIESQNEFSFDREGAVIDGWFRLKVTSGTSRYIYYSAEGNRTIGR